VDLIFDSHLSCVAALSFRFCVVVLFSSFVPLLVSTAAHHHVSGFARLPFLRLSSSCFTGCLLHQTKRKIIHHEQCATFFFIVNAPAHEPRSSDKQGKKIIAQTTTNLWLMKTSSIRCRRESCEGLNLCTVCGGSQTPMSVIPVIGETTILFSVATGNFAKCWLGE